MIYNEQISSIIQFTIKKDEDGVYCARATEYSIFTFSKTLPELEKISDAEAKLMARDIALKIEQELKYPGEIKVTMIRETRIIEYAR